MLAAEASGTADVHAQALNQLGVALRAAGQYAEALDVYNRAERLAEQAGNRQLGARIRLNRGLLTGMMGDYRSAVTMLAASVSEFRALENDDGRITALEGHANALQYLGDLDRARAIYDELSVELRKRGLHARLGSVLLNSSVAYGRVGRHQEAEQQLSEALGEAQKAGDRVLEAKILNSQSLALDRAGEMERAVAALQRLRTLALELGDAALAATTLHNIGAVVADKNRYGDRADFRRGVACFQRALQERRAIGAAADIAATLDALGATLSNLGNFDAAGEALSEAARQFAILGDIRREANAYGNHGWNEIRRKRYEDAAPLLRRAADLADAQRAAIASDGDRVSYFASASVTRLLLVDVLMEVGRVEDAFLTLEAARARGLLDQLARIRSEGLDPSTVAAADGARQARSRWADADRQLSRLIQASASGTEGARENARNERDAAGRELARAERALSAQLGFGTVAEPGDIRRLQALLDPRDAVVSYKTGNTRMQVFVLTRDSLEGITVAGSGAALRENVIQFRSAIENGRDGLREGALLHQRLLEAAWPLLEGRTRIRFVADGPLGLVPFAALPSDASDEQSRLLWKFDAIGSLPSVSALEHLSRPVRGPDTERRPGLIVGRPSYALSAARIPGCGSISLADLPFSAREAAAVGRSLGVPDGDSDLLLGTQATLSAIRSHDLARYRNLHFAVHGILCGRDGGRLLDPVLAFSPEAEGEAASLLSPPDIAGLKLDADLVVLSGCETGLGSEAGGEGILSLARSFMAAGSRAVMATLWRIDDASTASMMEEFYRRVSAGEDIAAALVAAQRWLATEHFAADSRGDPVPLSMPLYWAAFTLHGAPQR